MSNSANVPNPQHLLTLALLQLYNCNQPRAMSEPREDGPSAQSGITFTPRATQRLREIMRQKNNANMALHISVESGGSGGMRYVMSLVDRQNINPEDDISFVSDGKSGKGDDGAKDTEGMVGGSKEKEMAKDVGDVLAKLA